MENGKWKMENAGGRERGEMQNEKCKVQNEKCRFDALCLLKVLSLSKGKMGAAARSLECWVDCGLRVLCAAEEDAAYDGRVRTEMAGRWLLPRRF